MQSVSGLLFQVSRKEASANEGDVGKLMSEAMHAKLLYASCMPTGLMIEVFTASTQAGDGNCGC